MAIEPKAAGPTLSALRTTRRLRGRFEVIVGGNDGRILFADSLDEVASILNEITRGALRKEDLLLLLQSSDQRQELRAGGRGRMFYSPAAGLGAERSWVARARGARERNPPRFHPGQAVVVNPDGPALPGNMGKGSHWVIGSVELTAHGNPGKMYRYQIGSYSVGESSLLPAPVRSRAAAELADR